MLPSTWEPAQSSSWNWERYVLIITSLKHCCKICLITCRSWHVCRWATLPRSIPRGQDILVIWTITSNTSHPETYVPSHHVLFPPPPTFWSPPSHGLIPLPWTHPSILPLFPSRHPFYRLTLPFPSPSVVPNGWLSMVWPTRSLGWWWSHLLPPIKTQHLDR